jgi:hypothetical protein
MKLRMRLRLLSPLGARLGGLAFGGLPDKLVKGAIMIPTIKVINGMSMAVLLLTISGCSFFLGQQPSYRSLYVSPPFQIIGRVIVFYGGFLPGPVEPDPSILTADKAVGADVRVNTILGGQGFAVGDVIRIFWVVDTGPCLSWKVTPTIRKNARVEVDDTGDMMADICTSYVKPAE